MQESVLESYQLTTVTLGASRLVHLGRYLLRLSSLVPILESTKIQSQRCGCSCHSKLLFTHTTQTDSAMHIYIYTHVYFFYF